MLGQRGCTHATLVIHVCVCVCDEFSGQASLQIPDEGRKTGSTLLSKNWSV